MTLRHPNTIRLDVPYSLYASPAQCASALSTAARQQDWERTANIRAVDERVLWTMEEDHAELWFRVRPLDEPLPGFEGV